MRQRSATPFVSPRVLVGIGLLVTAAFVAIAWTSFAGMYRRDADLARANANNLVASLSAEIGRNIELYDLSLQAAMDNIDIPGFWDLPRQVQDTMLFDRAATAQHLGVIKVIDAGGNLLIQSRRDPGRLSGYDDRPYFIYHRDNPGNERHISGPWMNARGEYVLGLSRRISGPDGAFRGVAVGTLRLSYFHDLFRRLTLAPEDTITLTLETGRLIMRTPFDIAYIGRDIRTSAIFRHFNALEAGEFVARAPSDHIERMYIYRRIGKDQLRLNYGVSTGTLYRSWLGGIALLAAGVALVSILNMLLFCFLAWSLERQRIAEGKLAALATTDSLTGLANRRAFDIAAAAEWRRARRTGLPVSVLMLDADYFKAFNDTHGHRAGDRAIAAIAQCIKAHTRRESDCAARYGGEEFALVLGGTGRAGAENVAEIIRRSIADLRRDGDRPDFPTVSVGVASIVPHSGMTLDRLICDADAALYQAKAAGRNCVRCADTPAADSEAPLAA